MSVKKGRLTKEEMEFIYKNCLEQTDDEIALHLNRTAATVRNYRQKLGRGKGINRDAAIISNELRAKPQWPILQQQFSNKELQRIEQLWISIYEQFGRDVLPLEELQILDLVKAEILIDRILIEKHAVAKDCERIEQLIKDIYSRYDENNKMPDDVYQNLMNLEQQLAGYKNISSAKTREQSDLIQRKERAYKDLKGTRDQRIKNLESATANFLSFLRGLEDPKTRRKESREAELSRLAMDRAYDSLGELHTYVDGTVEPTILNAETIMEVEDG